MQQACFDWDEAERWSESEPTWVSPERGRCMLLLSVIKNSAQALERWCRYIDTPGSWTRECDLSLLREDAITGYLYLMDNDPSEWCGFVSACAVNDLDPDAVRDSIMRRMSRAGIGMLRFVIEMMGGRSVDLDAEIAA